MKNLQKLLRDLIVLLIFVWAFAFYFIREEFAHYADRDSKYEDNYRNTSSSRVVYKRKPHFLSLTQTLTEVNLVNSSYELGSVFHKKKCKQDLGTIAVLQYTDHWYEKKVAGNAMQSVRCYTKMRGYPLYQFDADFTADILSACEQFQHLLAKRHCLTAQLLMKYDYILFIDGDSGIINPNHCIEEYINPKVDMMLLIRDTTGEIEAGQYIAKNSSFSYRFLILWAKLTENIYPEDQSALHKVLTLKVLNANEREICQSLLKVLPRPGRRTQPRPYWKWASCIVNSLRRRKLKSIRQCRIQIFARSQGFARDTWPTNYLWSRTDFILHYWKYKHDVYLSRKMRAHDCKGDKWNIPYISKLKVDDNTLLQAWIEVEKKNPSLRKGYAVLIPFTHCWPNCTNIIV